MMLALKYDEKGLIPAIIQDYNSKKVLMLGYMNEESLQKTIETKKTWFFSRSRNKLWNKGETSGHYQDVKKIAYDCDEDTLLVEVIPHGNTCHTGNESCFYRDLLNGGDAVVKTENVVDAVIETIADRRNNPKEGSYTNYLFEKGIDKILKKVGEEASEVIIAAKNDDKQELIYELSDLVFHCLVLMNERGVSKDEIKEELKKRYK